MLIVAMEDHSIQDKAQV